MNGIYMYKRFSVSKCIIKQDIIVDKSFFKFPTPQLMYLFSHKYMVYIVRYHYSLATQFYKWCVYTTWNTTARYYI